MALCLDAKDLEVIYGGKTYQLSPLKLKDQLLAKKLDSGNEEEVVETIYQILENSGLPRSISEELSIASSYEVIEGLMTISKKEEKKS